jgi:hypothetical protein
MDANAYVRAILRGERNVLSRIHSHLRRWVQKLLDNGDVVPNDKLWMIQHAAKKLVVLDRTANRRLVQRRREWKKTVASRVVTDVATPIQQTAADADHWKRS